MQHEAATHFGQFDPKFNLLAFFDLASWQYETIVVRQDDCGSWYWGILG